MDTDDHDIDMSRSAQSTVFSPTYEYELEQTKSLIDPRRSTETLQIDRKYTRVLKIDFLRHGVRKSLDAIDDTTKDLMIKHLIPFKPYQRIARVCTRTHDQIEIVGQRDILSITKQKLIEKLTHDYEQDSEITIAVLFTYSWFMTEKELFMFLLERFKTPLPVNLSPKERQLLLDNVISKVQIKVLIFLKDWFKLYLHKVRQDQELEEMFFELLFLMYSHPDTGKWIKLPISQLLQDLERLNNFRDNSIKPCKLCFTALPEIFVPFYIIKDYQHLLAKQLCIFDYENFKNLKVTEFFNRSWTTDDKKQLSPTLTYIAESSTKLSRMVSYLILMNKKNFLRVNLYQQLIEICDQLVRLKNYNSAFAIYLGLQSQAVQRLKDLLEPNLQAQYKDIWSGLQMLFSATNNMANFKKKQMDLISPSVPYLGPFLQDLFFIEEYPNFLDKEKGMINFNKFRMMSNKLNKLLSFMGPYGFHKVDPVQNFLRGLPFISEDQIYDLSYKIMK